MRILFASTAGAGHFSPLVPFAHACVRAGHDVLVVGQAGCEPLAERAGLRFRGVDEPSREDLARFQAGQAGLDPMQAAARAFTDLYVDLHGAAALPGMLAAMEDWRPDVVVREVAEFGSLVAAERVGVPHTQVGIGLSTALADRMLAMAAPAIDALRASVDLAPDPEASAARSLVLTMAPASLEGDAAAPPAGVQRFRAPSAPAAELEPFGDPAAPLVSLSFGTEVPSPARSYFPGLYRDAIAALAE